MARSGGRIILRPGVKILISPEINPFSASKGLLNPLINEMCRTSPQPYDACIGINDIALLAHRLFYRGIVGELGKAKVSQIFTHFECKQVSYNTLSRGSEHGQAPEASPFLKDLKFASQREIRVALFPRAPIASTTLIVQLSRPDQLFLRSFVRFLAVKTSRLRHGRDNSEGRGPYAGL